MIGGSNHEYLLSIIYCVKGDGTGNPLLWYHL